MSNLARLEELAHELAETRPWQRGYLADVALTSGPDGIAVLDMQGTVLLWSTEMVGLTDILAQHAVGKPLEYRVAGIVGDDLDAALHGMACARQRVRFDFGRLAGFADVLAWPLVQDGEQKGVMVSLRPLDMYVSRKRLILGAGA